MEKRIGGWIWAIIAVYIAGAIVTIFLSWRRWRCRSLLMLRPVALGGAMVLLAGCTPAMVLWRVSDGDVSPDGINVRTREEMEAAARVSIQVEDDRALVRAYQLAGFNLIPIFARPAEKRLEMNEACAAQFPGSHAIGEEPRWSPFGLVSVAYCVAQIPVSDQDAVLLCGDFDRVLELNRPATNTVICGARTTEETKEGV